MSKSIIRTNPRGEQQIDSVGRIIQENCEDVAIEFKIPMHGVPFTVNCALPFEFENECQVQVFNDHGQQIKQLTARVRSEGKCLSFYFGLLFWTIVCIVPLPDEDTGVRVPVFVKPASLKPTCHLSDNEVASLAERVVEDHFNSGRRP